MVVLNIFSNLVVYPRPIISISDVVVRTFATAISVIAVNAEYDFFSKLLIVYHSSYWNIFANLTEKMSLTKNMLKCLILKGAKLFC